MVVGGSNSILIDVELLFGLFPLCETGLRLGLLGMYNFLVTYYAAVLLVAVSVLKGPTCSMGSQQGYC